METETQNRKAILRRIAGLLVHCHKSANRRMSQTRSFGTYANAVNMRDACLDKLGELYARRHTVELDETGWPEELLPASRHWREMLDAEEAVERGRAEIKMEYEEFCGWLNGFVMNTTDDVSILGDLPELWADFKTTSDEVHQAWRDGDEELFALGLAHMGDMIADMDVAKVDEADEEQIGMISRVKKNI